jgi:hypothetical protein
MNSLLAAAVSAVACALGAQAATSAAQPIPAAPAAAPASAAALVPAEGAMSAPAATPAEPSAVPTLSRLVFGAQAALAFPTGTRDSGIPMDERTSRAVPLQLRAGWRITPEIEAGLQGGYALAEIASAWKQDCRDTGVSCGVHLWRLAARGEWSRRKPDYFPWAAVTLGWEWEVERWEQGSGNWEQATRSGWLAGIEAGIDRPFTRYFDAGIYAGFALGQYVGLSLTGETAGYGYSGSTSIHAPALHRWLTFGLRGSFTLQPQNDEAPAARATGAPRTSSAR